MGESGNGRAVSLYIDESSIEKTNGSAKAWTRLIPTNDPTNPQVSQSWILAQFECKNGRTKRLQETSLLKDGTTVNHNVADEWEYPIPGSLQDIAFSYVCFGKSPSSQLPQPQLDLKGSWRDKAELVEPVGRDLLAELFLTVYIGKSISVEIPRTWTILGPRDKKKIDDVVKSQAKTLSIDNESELPFAANFYDERGEAIALFSVRKYPDMDVSQPYIREADNDELAEIDRGIRSAIAIAGEKQGYEVQSWQGTKRQSLNGKVVLITEYTRAFSDRQSFRVRLIRLLDGHPQQPWFWQRDWPRCDMMPAG